MSRTTLCLGAAAVLIGVSLSIVLIRRQVLGDEIRQPSGPGTWKITMLVQGKTLADAHLATATPLVMGRQQIVREQARSEELVQRPQEQHSDRRELGWSQAPGVPPGLFRIRYECWMAIRSDAAQSESHHQYAPPHEGEYLGAEPGIECNHAEIAALARQVADPERSTQDQAEQLCQFVEEQIALDPGATSASVTALDCLHLGSGGSAARSRLLTALCRNRGIPARLVSGLILSDGEEQSTHTWVEVWANSHWLPICPTYHHFGKIPRTFVVFTFGDRKLAHGKNVRDLAPAFLVERVKSAAVDAAPASIWKRIFRAASLTQLPIAEQRLAEILLLLPVAALIICVFRNVIGVSSFGTFTPALIGLAFRDLRSWPGILVFVSIIMAGWGLRRVLNRFHLLQVPRISLMLSLVISMLVCFVVVSYRLHWPTTRYISMFPLVILTSMIERFWTLEEEDGTRASFRTLMATLFISGCISLVISRPVVTQHMLRYPETVGFIMAAIMLLGRYTGYRMLELYRFRDFVKQPALQHEPAALVVWNGRTSFGSNRF
jgi:hypothetical protein